jgi:plastocyanin
MTIEKMISVKGAMKQRRAAGAIKALALCGVWLWTWGYAAAPRAIGAEAQETTAANNTATITNANANANANATDVARLQTELNRLKQEVKEQRQLIFQLMQLEQQHFDVLLKYLHSGSASEGLPPLPAPGSLTLPGAPKVSGEAGEPSAAAAAPGRQFGTVSGRVRVSGQPVTEAYVYIDGLKTSTTRNHRIEIKQKDKQFSPRVAVVPLGTSVVFPNDDSVIHNVFSLNLGNAFDLGSVKSGEKSAPVTLLKPGHVEVFCNIHSKMRADILVVPNALWVRVSSDGSFQIPGVPTGARRIVLWSPNARLVSQQVDVTAKGTTVTFATDATANRPHLNKRKQAYGSYND